MKEKLNKKYLWWNVAAEREEKKGKAKGGILIAARKEIEETKIRGINKQVAEVEIIHNKNRWKIFVIYSQNVEEIMESIKETMPEEEEDYVLIGGDFNARTGNEGGPIVYDEEKGEEKRKSKDKIINREGKILLNKLQERGWMILNGSGEDEGGWT